MNYEMMFKEALAQLQASHVLTLDDLRKHPDYDAFYSYLEKLILYVMLNSNANKARLDSMKFFGFTRLEDFRQDVVLRALKNCSRWLVLSPDHAYRYIYALCNHLLCTVLKRDGRRYVMEISVDQSLDSTSSGKTIGEMVPSHTGSIDDSPMMLEAFVQEVLAPYLKICNQLRRPQKVLAYLAIHIMRLKPSQLSRVLLRHRADGDSRAVCINTLSELYCRRGAPMVVPLLMALRLTTSKNLPLRVETNDPNQVELALTNLIYSVRHDDLGVDMHGNPLPPEKLDGKTPASRKNSKFSNDPCE